MRATAGVQQRPRSAGHGARRTAWRVACRARRGRVAPTAPPACAAPRAQVVIKSQVLAGGRGLGKFKSGLQGGVHICSASKAVELAKQMLGGTLVTKQTGPQGKPVNTLMVARKMKVRARRACTEEARSPTARERTTGVAVRAHMMLCCTPPHPTPLAPVRPQLAREMYFAILLDRSTSGPIIIACSEGGTSIEDLAEQFPDKIIKVCARHAARAYAGVLWRPASHAARPRPRPRPGDGPLHRAAHAQCAARTVRTCVPQPMHARVRRCPSTSAWA